MYIRFCAALVLAATFAFGQNIDSSRIRYTATGAGAEQQALNSVLQQHHSVTDFGVVCDGTTDNSAAFATAIAAAQAGNFVLDLPSGTCAYSTTLNLANGVHLHGQAGTGFGYSALLYTGTGSAVLLKNTAGNNFIYNPYLDHLGILVSGAAQYGIEAYELSQAYFNDVSIAPTGSGTLQVGFYCGSLSNNTGCNIGTFNHLTIEQTTSHAVKLIHPAALTFTNDDFFNVAGADFAIGGNVTQLAIKDGWHEMSDMGILLDNSLVGTALNVFGLEVQNSRFLFNNAAFANQIALKANNTSGAQMIVSNLSFRDDTIALAGSGATNTRYPFQVIWSASPSAGSYFQGVIENTYINGIQNTGAFLSTTNGTIGQTLVTFKDIRAVDQTGTAFAVESSGAGTQYQSLKNNNGALAIGRNNQKLAATLSIQDNDSSDGGKTGINIFDGPNQGANSIMTFYDASSNPRSTFYNLGLAFFQTYGPAFLGNSGGLRWRNLVQGTESGGNTGSNWNLCRYSDAGSLLDCPVSVNRADGTFGLIKLSSSGIQYSDGSTQTSAGIQPSATVISVNTNVSSSGSKNQTFVASGNITVTLYAASAVPGGIVTVKKTDTNANSITILSLGGTMDGQTSITLARQFDSYTFLSDGTNWNLI